MSGPGATPDEGAARVTAEQDAARAESEGWVELYHPGLGATHRSQHAAYLAVWQHKGWLLADDAAGAVLARVVGAPSESTDAELLLALRQAGITANPEAERDRLLELLPDRAPAPVQDPNAPFDPAAHTVAEINEHIADADPAEAARVAAIEVAGRNRRGVKSQDSEE